MTIRSCPLLSPTLLLSLGLLSASLHPATAGDEQWGTEFGYPFPGTDAQVDCSIVYNGQLVIGGAFFEAGGVFTDRVATWDGSTWQNLGHITGGSVLDFAIYHGDLYAAGSFVYADGQLAPGIARFDGVQWRPVGSGLGGHGFGNTGRALTVYDDQLIVGGYFAWVGGPGGIPAAYIASWDGTSWSSPGGGVSHEIYDLAVYSGRIVAAEAGVLEAWDGTTWTYLNSGGTFYALGFFGSDLIVSGYFSGQNIARWDGSVWYPLGSGLNRSVYAIQVYKGSLIVGGAFESGGGDPLSHLARWNGARWQDVGGGTDGLVKTLAPFETGLFAGGSFLRAGSSVTANVAEWDGTAWGLVGPKGGNGADGSVEAMTEYQGALIVGGDFRHAGPAAASYIARWDGQTLQPLGSGTNRTVWAMAVDGNDLIVGGDFTIAGGVSAAHVARWNGAEWSSVGAGVNGTVCGLLVTPEGLIAAGRFTEAGRNPANHIAYYDSRAWHAMGQGLRKWWVNEDVAVGRSLVMHEGSIYVGGDFTEADGEPVYNIARWDGASWQPVGVGIPSTEDIMNGVHALASHGGRLYAGGWFTIPDPPAFYLESWDGSNWLPFEDQPDGPVYSLGTFMNTLVVGGQYTHLGDLQAGRIAQWTTEGGWAPLGSGIHGGSPPVVTSVCGQGSDLYLGGNFIQAGETPSYGIARWAAGSAAITSLDENPTFLVCAPNPYRPGQTIRLSGFAGTEVPVRVYDPQGRLVRALSALVEPGGMARLCWDGRSTSGTPLGNGVYLLSGGAGGRGQTHRLVLVR